MKNSMAHLDFDYYAFVDGLGAVGTAEKRANRNKKKKKKRKAKKGKRTLADGGEEDEEVDDIVPAPDTEGDAVEYKWIQDRHNFLLFRDSHGGMFAMCASSVIVACLQTLNSIVMVSCASLSHCLSEW